MAACIIYLIFCIAAAAAAPGSRRYGIADGELTNIDKYPFQVAVLYYRSLMCSGEIINSRHILTSGICIFLPDKKIKVRAGSSFYNKGGTLYGIAESMRHPDFGTEALNDIGIYRTTTDIVFSDVVKPVNIAPPDYKLDDDEPVWLTGWGNAKMKGNLSYRLRHVELLTVNHKKCKRDYQNDINIVEETMVCAGSDRGGSFCQDDEGGPLLHNGVLVGIVSFGIGCNSTVIPGVYTRISSYNEWIKDNS